MFVHSAVPWNIDVKIYGEISPIMLAKNVFKLSKVTSLKCFHYNEWNNANIYHFYPLTSPFLLFNLTSSFLSITVVGTLRDISVFVFLLHLSLTNPKF